MIARISSVMFSIVPGCSFAERLLLGDFAVRMNVNYFCASQVENTENRNLGVSELRSYGITGKASLQVEDFKLKTRPDKKGRNHSGLGEERESSQDHGIPPSLLRQVPAQGIQGCLGDRSTREVPRV